MTTAQIGVKSGNVLIPYVSTTKRTKVINTTSTSDIVLLGTGITTHPVPDSYFYAYADSVGKWRLVFNLTCIRATGTGARISAAIRFAGSYPVVFKNTVDFEQPVAVGSNSNIIAIKAVASPNTGDIVMYHANSDETGYSVSGDCELNAEPTWAAANMEGVIAADIYIAPASDTVVGLLSYYKEDDITLAAATWNPDGIGSGNSAAFAARITRINRVVTITFPTCITADPNGTTAQLALSVTLPTWCRPSFSQVASVTMYENRAWKTGSLEISSTGAVWLYGPGLGGFTTGTNNAGIISTSVSFAI